MTCREYSSMRDDSTAEARGVLGNDTLFVPIHDARFTVHYGRIGIEVQIDSLREDGTKSCVVLSRGVD